MHVISDCVITVSDRWGTHKHCRFKNVAKIWHPPDVVCQFQYNLNRGIHFILHLPEAVLKLGRDGVTVESFIPISWKAKRSVMALLTTWQRWAAVLCLVDQLLSGFTAGGAWLLCAWTALTLDTHGIFVTHTSVATTDPFFTKLVKKANVTKSETQLRIC